MNFYKILSIFTFTYGVNTCFAMTDTNPPSVEKASQFTQEETAIFNQKTNTVLNNVFKNQLSYPPTTCVNHFHQILDECGKQRHSIAHEVLKTGEINEFGIYRTLYDAGRGESAYQTQLNINDNMHLYKVIYQKFLKGSESYGSMQTKLIYMSYTQKAFINQLRDLTVATRIIKGSGKSTSNYLKKSEASEEICFSKLLDSDNVIELFNKNPELGTITMTSKKHFSILSNPDVQMATLRLTVTLNPSTTIPIGSLNCLSLPQDNGQINYYQYFVIDHVRSDNINLLLTRSQEHWRDCILSDRTDSVLLKDNLAQFYWFLEIAAPFQRGSEAISKWFLTLTARYLDKELVYSQNFSFRMPFAMSVEEFIEYFSKNVFFMDELEQDLV